MCDCGVIPVELVTVWSGEAGKCVIVRNGGAGECVIV